MINHGKYNGILLLNDSNFVGHLTIGGAESVANIFGKSRWERTATELKDIHGMLSDGKKVSLLTCVITSQKTRHFGANSQFESEYFPNYILVADEHISSDEPVIRAVSYHFTNIARLLTGHKTFQTLQADHEQLISLLKVDHERSETLAREQGWPERSFDPEIGPHPQLLYFSGVREIIATEINIGRISLTNRTSHSYGDAKGIGIDNEVTANIHFSEPVTVSQAVDALHTFHSLLEISFGHRQRYQWIELELTHLVKDEGYSRHQTAQLYWSLCNERVKDDSKTNSIDILLAPDRRPEEFVKVAAGWMDSEAKMGDPRARFATGFFGPYGINRIVGAANMFDLLPDSHAPKKIKLDTSLKAAVEASQKAFKILPASSARDSVLSALGRVGTASLRDKVMFRAQMIMDEVGAKLPDLDVPCKQAVSARNHYVHGSPASFDYRQHFTEFAFIIDTLEFVFAVSDLIDLGWDLQRWVAQGTTMTHAFGSYFVNYPQNISSLKNLVCK